MNNRGCAPLFAVNASLDSKAAVVKKEDSGLHALPNHYRNFLDSKLPKEMVKTQCCRKVIGLTDCRLQ